MDHLNPLTYAIDLLRHIPYAESELGEASRSLLLGNSVGEDIVVIGAIGAVLLVASTFSFARMG